MRPYGWKYPANVTPAINLQVLLFVVTLAVLTSIGFGLAPALKLSRSHVTTLALAGQSRRGSQVRQ